MRVKLLERLLDRNSQIIEQTYNKCELKKKIQSNHTTKRFEKYIDKLLDNKLLRKDALDKLYTTIVNSTKKLNIKI